jgi:HrpA-like RNA helicase
MSASMQETIFRDYFSVPSEGKVCPVLYIPGRTYPVSIKYLPDALKFIGSSSASTYNNTPEQRLSKFIFKLAGFSLLRDLSFPQSRKGKPNLLQHLLLQLLQDHPN